MTEAADGGEAPVPENRAFLFVIAGTIGLGVAAYGFSLLLKTDLSSHFAWSFKDFAIGVAAAIPLSLFLWWFTTTKLDHLAAFRRSQIKFFAEIGFKFTPLRIALMALGAGVCEELFFRGVLQTWIAGLAPVEIAIIASNVVFGLLHMRTLLYALIAGAVGVYLGVLFAATGNLLAPMAAHALYDAVALEYTRRAIIAHASELNASTPA